MEPGYLENRIQQLSDARNPAYNHGQHAQKQLQSKHSIIPIIQEQKPSWGAALQQQISSIPADH